MEQILIPSCGGGGGVRHALRFSTSRHGCICSSTFSNWSLSLKSFHHYSIDSKALFTTTTTASLFQSLRKRSFRKKLIGEKIISKMSEHEGKAITADVTSGNMVFQPILKEGIFRFDCSANDRDAAYPSLSFTNTKDRDTPIVSHMLPVFTPTFECLLGQQIVKIELPGVSSFYGTGEVSGQLERTGKRVFTWNTDAWGYGSGTTSLYQSHPWVLAVLPNGEALGVLADTTRRCEIDLRKGSRIQFTSPSSYPVITFGPFASPTDVLRYLSNAIGTIFMPPKWSLGYQQCRWSYDSDARVLEIAKTFREKAIPCDVIWMDIDYMDGFRCFTFDQCYTDVDSGSQDPLSGFCAFRGSHLITWKRKLYLVHLRSQMLTLGSYEVMWLSRYLHTNLRESVGKEDFTPRF